MGPEIIIYNTFYARVAQWIRASRFGRESRGFESLRGYQIYGSFATTS